MPTSYLIPSLIFILTPTIHPTQWALPGGMVDDGEKVSATVKREFEEEAGNIGDPAERHQFQEHVAKLFENGRQIYRGYIDDPRNTDNAWTETTAFHFHCSDQLGAQLQLRSGDDAGAVKWLNVDGEGMQQESYRKLYGAHRSLIERAVRHLQGEVAPDSRCDEEGSIPHLLRSDSSSACLPHAAGVSTGGFVRSRCSRSLQRLCRSRWVPIPSSTCCRYRKRSSAKGLQRRSSPV